MTAARLQRWSLILSAYNYDISYRSTKLHSNADALSRLPLPSPKEDPGGVSYDNLFNLGQLEVLPVTSTQIAAATRSDLVLSLVYQYLNQGWPNSVPSNLKPYFHRKHELSSQQGCLLWGIRVIIPGKYREQVLAELHQDHPGISRMKEVGRSLVWWPGFDHDVEVLVKQCTPCLSVKSPPPKAPLNPWLWPAKPWSRVHVDFMGPLFGKTYLVLVDAHSKWPEVFEMSSITSCKTIEVLRHIFASHGLPDHIVSDNGPQFTSLEFRQFLRCNGIKHTCSAPYHPATNGCAERFVQTLKRAILVGRGDARSTQHKLSSFLLNYRSTPHASTGVAPSILLKNRKLKTILDLVKPNVGNRVREKQSSQKRNYDSRAQDREIEIGDSVLGQVHHGNTVVWEAGKVVDKVSPVSFIVEMNADRSSRRFHIDQIKKVKEVEQSPVVDTTSFPSMETPPDVSDPEEDFVPEIITRPEHSPDTSESRYPTRVRHPPDRYVV